MPRFKRVKDQTPSDNIVNAVSGQPANNYNKLKGNSAARKQTIAKNASDFKETRTAAKDWEKVSQSETYQDRQFPKEISDDFLGSLEGTVRRVSADTMPDSSRGLDEVSHQQNYSNENWINAMIDGNASMFDNPDMNELKKAFASSQKTDTHEVQFRSKEQFDLLNAEKHDQWESDSREEYVNEKYSSNGNPIMKTGHEMTSDSGYYLIDPNTLEGEEKMRVEIRNNKRERTAGIKSVGRSREEVHQAWEDGIVQTSSSYQEYYADNGIDLEI
jgi:hypothetical protein